MFRVNTYATKTRILLHRTVPLSPQLAALSRTPVIKAKYRAPGTPERGEIIPPPPKICPPTKDDKFFWMCIAGLIVTASFATLVKDNCEIRDWLSIYAPWFDDLIAFAFRENYSYTDYLALKVVEIRRAYEKYLKIEECSKKDKEEILVTDPCCLLDNEEEEVDEGKDGEEEPCVELPKPVAPIEICELEVCVEDLYRTANNNLTTARDACKVFNEIVKETMLNFEYMKLKALQKEMDDRRELVKSTVKDGTTAKGQMDELGRFIDCKGAIGPDKVVTAVRDNIDDYDTILKRIKEEFLWENDRSAAIDGQWKLVEKDIEDYIEQIQSYYPTLTYADKKKNIANEDLDFLLIHSLKKERDAVPRVQWEADKLDDRTTRAFCDIESKDDKELLNREKKLDKEIIKGMGTLDKEYWARTKYVNEKNKKTRKAELAAQKKRQEEETKIVMEKKEKELQAKFKRRVADQVALEKLKMRTQLNDMKAKVDIVERKLKARLKAEEEIKRSKALHKAGSDLLAATKKGEPYVCVLKELRAIEKASGKNDKLVNSVLNSIPDEVWQNGIVPESALKQRYSSMEDVAAKVALIEGDGAPLPIYVLSWMQYMLLFMKPKTIPQDEIDHPPVKPNTDLDTFDRLQRARYYVNDGNIKAALPYVDTLEGASRAAAAAWHDAARGYVETKQAAEAIMAHASAIGLQYV